MFIEEQMFTFLCHLSRKHVSGPFVSQLVGALLHPLLRYAAPFVSFNTPAEKTRKPAQIVDPRTGSGEGIDQ
jgi:hypothetical protein